MCVGKGNAGNAEICRRQGYGGQVVQERHELICKAHGERFHGALENLRASDGLVGSNYRRDLRTSGASVLLRTG
jgi:hypothetical protein